MRGWVRRILGGALTVALVGAAATAWVALGEDPACDTAYRDLDGRCAVLDEAPDVAAADPRPTGGRFQAPAQDLDVPLVEMSAGATLNPPTLTDAFLLRDADRTSADGTRARVVAMHAVREGRAPGNAFFEPGSAEPAVLVQPGDPLVVDRVAYVVTGAEVLDKNKTADAPSVWGYHPDGDDRLVVITCLQRYGTTGFATENLVVHAVRSAA